MTLQNSEINLPADKSDAIRWVYQQAHKIGKERAWMAGQIKDRLSEAKAIGIRPKEIRLAARLQRMSAEKRQSWEEQINGAAKLLGYEPLALTGMPEKHGPEIETVNAIVHLENERKEIGERLTDIFAAAAEAEIDVASIKTFLRMSAKDATEIQDWFDGIDATGKVLGVWEGNFADLHD